MKWVNIWQVPQRSRYYKAYEALISDNRFQVSCLLTSGVLWVMSKTGYPLIDWRPVSRTRAPKIRDNFDPRRVI